VAEEVTFTDFVKSIAQSPEETRLKIAKQLKQAGLYKGSVSSKFNNALYDALTEAEKKRVQIAAITGPVERLGFIDELASEGRGTGGAETVTSRVISAPGELLDEIDAVTREYLGRELPDAAKKKLAEKYIAKQKAGQLDTTTAYSGDGSFRQTTGGGISPTQFFIEEVSNSDEGRANKVLQGYDIFMRALGGLR
jgi:hypothetical protein